jgi:signal peptidase II
MKKIWILLVACFGILLLDQWTKTAVQAQFPLYRSVPVIEGFFNLTHVRNRGGAFGVFGGERGELGTFLFIGISVVAVGVLLYLFLKSKEKDGLLRFSLSLILSGALGNLADRLRFGEVIDFLDFYVGTYHWPAFNIADSAISVGVALMAFEMLFRDSRKPKGKAHS